MANIFPRVTDPRGGAAAALAFPSKRSDVAPHSPTLGRPERIPELLDALVAEHAPDGPTEEHLVEELAGIIWRKRRLRMAEAAVYREKLRHDATGYQAPEHLVGAALLPLTGSAEGKASIPQALVATPVATARDLRDVKRDQTMTRNAWNILMAGGPEAYPRAVAALREDTRAYWQECLAERPADGMTYAPTVDALGPGSIVTGKNGTTTRSPNWRTAAQSETTPSAAPMPHTLWMCRLGMKSTSIAS